MQMFGTDCKQGQHMDLTVKVTYTRFCNEALLATQHALRL